MRIKRLLNNIFTKPIENYEYKGIKGYKVFKEDWTCRGFQYEVGETYKYEGEIKVCKEGFHFCEKLSSCFNYYKFNPKNKVAEVEALGVVKTKGEKSVANEIKIVKELGWFEVLNMVNLGEGNIGIGNTGNGNEGNWNVGNNNIGNWNTGKWNSGNWNVGNNNIGNLNSGNYNAGDCNTGNCNNGQYNGGDCNIGHCNIGDYNSGHCNIGYCNSGHYNIGNCNSGDYNTGIFNTITPNLYMFNKPSEWTMNDWINSDARKILEYNSGLTEWINEEDMTDEEKEENPDYKILGGYLKVFTYKEMHINMWNGLTDEEKEVIKRLPNFDKDVFEEITGIRL